MMLRRPEGEHCPASKELSSSPCPQVGLKTKPPIIPCNLLPCQRGNTPGRWTIAKAGMRHSRPVAHKWRCYHEEHQFSPHPPSRPLLGGGQTTLGSPQPPPLHSANNSHTMLITSRGQLVFISMQQSKHQGSCP